MGKISEMYQMDDARSGSSTPSPLSEKRKSFPMAFPDMPYVLEVSKPNEAHVLDKV